MNTDFTKLSDSELETIMKDNSIVKERGRQLEGGLAITLICTPIAAKLISTVLRYQGQDETANYLDSNIDYFAMLPQSLILAANGAFHLINPKHNAQRENYYQAKEILEERKQTTNFQYELNV